MKTFFFVICFSSVVWGLKLFQTSFYFLNREKLLVVVLFWRHHWLLLLKSASNPIRHCLLVCLSVLTEFSESVNQTCSCFTWKNTSDPILMLYLHNFIIVFFIIIMTSFSSIFYTWRVSDWEFLLIWWVSAQKLVMGFIPGRVLPKTIKLVAIVSLFITRVGSNQGWIWGVWSAGDSWAGHRCCPLRNQGQISQVSSLRL